MQNKKCVCCGVIFQPRAQTPTQTFCSETACQRTRRRLWNKEKLLNDPDYRDNKARLQRAWQDKHSDYWRNYRQSHPEYAARNRKRQREKSSDRPSNNIAKMNVLSNGRDLPKGLYWIEQINLGEKEIAGRWSVKITFIGREDNCKGDACKDRT
jgi:hypothetical protein